MDKENITPEETARRKLVIRKSKRLIEAEEKNNQLSNEICSLKDSYLRLAAEFDNYRKRTANEKIQIYSDAISDVAEKLLPVIDNLERAMEFIDDADEAAKKGINMIYNQFHEFLGSLGIEEISALNQPFDPNFHEAVMHIEDDKFGENLVVEVFKKGYKINDKVIRHSVVKVAN